MALALEARPTPKIPPRGSRPPAEEKPLARSIKEIRPQLGPQEQFLASDADIAIFGGAAFAGKALDIDTPLPTPTGWTTMGAVRPGDWLLSDEGKPCRVTMVSRIEKKEAFAVRFLCGAEVVASGDHLWETSTSLERLRLGRNSEEWRAARRARRAKRGTGKKPWVALRNFQQRRSLLLPTASIRTTEQIADGLIGARGRFEHSIRCAAPLDLPETPLPLDPYTLGAWLGDGTSVTGSISGYDEEIFSEVANGGFEVHHIPSQHGLTRRVRGLTAVLRSMGLLGNKHIPPSYLRASKDQRLALLRGLMDTDGHCDKKGKCEYLTTSPQLRDGVFELLVGLGIKPWVSEGRATLNGRFICPSYRFGFVSSLRVFRLPRKLLRQKVAGFRRTATSRTVCEVRPLGQRRVKCVAIDSPSKLYLAGRAMVPTHNTFALLLEPLRHKDVENFNAVIFRRTLKQATNPGGLWDESCALYGSFGATPAVGPLEHRFPGSGAVVKFAGMEHVNDRFSWDGAQIPFLGFDQLEHFEWIQFWYMLSRNRDPSGQVRPYLRATCNPDPDSWLASFLSWWIDQATGFPIKERAGKVRWFIRLENDTLVWADSYEELFERFKNPALPPEHAEQPKPLSVTFIPGTIHDNVLGMERDPLYLSKLKGMGKVERERLLGGNWKIRAAAGLLFRREWLEENGAKMLDSEPADDRFEAIVRAWDLAATEKTESNDPAWTCGVKLGRYKPHLVGGRKRWCILHVDRGQWSPAKVEGKVRQHAVADGKHVRVRGPQDPGQAGKDQAQRFVGLLAGYDARFRVETGDKETRFNPFSAQAERGNVDCVRGPWNDEFFRTLESFPDGKVKDDADACSAAFDELLLFGGPVDVAGGSAVSGAGETGSAVEADDSPFGMRR